MILRTVSAGLVVLLAGCAGRTPEWPPSWMLVRPQGDSRLMVTLRTYSWGPALLAVGDTLRLRVVEERCRSDVCSALLARVPPRAWRTNRPRIAIIDSMGVLRGLAPGRVTVAVPWDGERLMRVFLVLPPVAAVRWEPRPEVMHVGDTVWLRARASDSAGHHVAYVPLAHTRPLEKTYVGSPVPDRSDSLRYRFAPERPGRIRLVTELAHRADSVDVRLIP